MGIDLKKFLDKAWNFIVSVSDESDKVSEDWKIQ